MSAASLQWYVATDMNSSLPTNHIINHAPRPRSRLSELPKELKMKIMGHMENPYFLMDLTHADAGYYRVFKLNHERIATQVLKNTIPEAFYTHAIVAYECSKNKFVIPNLESIDVDDIEGYVTKVSQVRDSAAKVRVRLVSAIRVYKMYCRVFDLAGMFIRQCHGAPSQNFEALYRSLREKPPSSSEVRRAAQAIYLLEILACMCKKLVFKASHHADHPDDYNRKIMKLHDTLMEKLLAPWEMYQVIGMQAFFRRILGALEQEYDVAEYVMAGVLAGGVTSLYSILRETGVGALPQYADRITSKPQRAFGMILSRGFRANRWSREAPEPSAYQPFWSSDNKTVSETKMWEKIEQQQVMWCRPSTRFNDVFDIFERSVEGRLDLWSAGIWDIERWEDVVKSFMAPMSEWSGLEWHHNPIILGYLLPLTENDRGDIGNVLNW